MNNLQIFNNAEFGEVRVVEINSKLYAVGNDIAKALEYARPHEAVTSHCKGAVTYRILTNGGEQDAKVVPEGDIYRLIVKAADQSKNTDIQEKAQRFESWIFDEILPNLRKTGGFVANEDLFINTYLPTADENTKTLFKVTLETIRLQNDRLSIMAPKADYFDALVDRCLLTNFRDTAKELKIKESNFINWLIEKKYVYRDQKKKLKPYAEHVPSLFEIKEWNGANTVGTQTLVTPRGRETFRLLLKKTLYVVS